MTIECPKCQHENPDETAFCGKCGTKFDADVGPTKTLETPTEELRRGGVFAGRYEIIEELGKGGMGKVYRVEDKKAKEEIALKLIKPEIAADKKTIERFRNELTTARKISHRNVCRMYDLGEEKGAHFITMEYVPGEDLKSLIRRVKVDIGTTIKIAKQVCEGLSEAHRLGVVHRDLKPSNIMIDKEGEAKIMDFGIARTIKEKRITGSGVMIGTPEYMSPEQVEAKDIDQRTDIYALGIILYEMVTGQLPFEGDTPLNIAMKHKSEAPKNPKEYNPQIPEAVSRVIQRCLEKNREMRYQTVEEVLSELGMIGRPKAGTTGIPGWKNSIAVLPFADLSPQKDQEYFCDGIAEELISTLTQVKDLKVAARTSAFSFKGKDIDIREIGEKLNVDKVLEGSVRKAGNRLRITAQLINVADGYHLWSEKYDREMENIFAIQDEISLAIVDKLKVKLLAEEKEAVVKHYTEDPEAYNLYLKGNYFVRKAYIEEMQKGIEYFQKAIERDPNYAPAYVGISEIFSISGIMTMVPPRDTLPKAKDPLMKALKIDDTLDEAHTVSALISFYYDWSWSEAEKGFKKAISINPHNAFTRCWYAWYLLAMSRFDESILEVQKAQELDPLVPVYYGGGICIYDCAGRFNDALEQFHKAIEIDPNFAYAYFHLGRIYALKGGYEEALSCFQKCLDLSGEFPWAEGYRGYIYAVTGQRRKAEQIRNKLIEQKKTRYITSWSIALLSLGLGQKDEAFVWLEKAYDERDTMMPVANALSDLDGLRSDPRFIALLKKMKLKE
jgi:serine/threonine protein kinase/tetratricopeptide (TPR) repeat protein